MALAGKDQVRRSWLRCLDLPVCLHSFWLLISSDLVGSGAQNVAPRTWTIRCKQYWLHDGHMCWNSLASRCIWYSIGGKDLRKKVSLPELWNGLVCRAYFGCNGLPSSNTAASPSNLFWLSEGFFSQPLKMEVALASLLYKWVAAGSLFQVIYYAIYVYI